MNKNLWILTEERPKSNVIATIINKFALDYRIACFIDTIRILPILSDSKDFSFTYEVIGFTSKKINKIFIKIVSGRSSFVDYLVFFKNCEPNKSDIPLYAIEETKTDDSESRNTGIYQRSTKFVYFDFFYSGIKKVMLYNLKVEQKEKQSDTNIFGSRCLLTLGVEILGRNLDKNIYRPFTNIDELICFKNSMRKAPKGNVPINICKTKSSIEVSGRLVKSDSLSHDPNIGALSLICATLRELGWDNKIIIIEHGLNQNHLNGNNKFVQIANRLNISFKGLNLMTTQHLMNNDYWHYEENGEKLATIFIDIIVESFTNGYSIFDNHAGCEKSYFLTKEGKYIPLKKYENKEQYKKGDKSKIINIPDLILIDIDSKKVINIEGKKYINRKIGIKELTNFISIEDLYIKPNYPKFQIVKTLVLYGSNNEKIIECEIGFLLNKNGKMILGIEAPRLFKVAIKNLLDFYS